MRLTGHATGVLVADVHRSAAYHRDRLGFEVGHSDENPAHYAQVGPDGCFVHFGRG